MIPSKLTPFLSYLEPEKYQKLKEFAAANKTPMTRIVREAINARLSSGDLYMAGFNDGLQKAMECVEKNKAAQIKFPSGDSVADIVNRSIKNEFVSKA